MKSIRTAKPTREVDFRRITHAASFDEFQCPIHRDPVIEAAQPEYQPLVWGFRFRCGCRVRIRKTSQAKESAFRMEKFIAIDERELIGAKIIGAEGYGGYS